MGVSWACRGACLGSVVVAGRRDRHAHQVAMEVDGAHDARHQHGEDLVRARRLREIARDCTRLREIARGSPEALPRLPRECARSREISCEPARLSELGRVEEVHAGVGAKRDVVVLARAVDVFEGLLLWQASEAVPSSDLRSDRGGSSQAQRRRSAGSDEQPAQVRSELKGRSRRRGWPAAGVARAAETAETAGGGGGVVRGGGRRGRRRRPRRRSASPSGFGRSASPRCRRRVQTRTGLARPAHGVVD